MPVIASDLKARLSGGAANNVPAASLGGEMSSVDLSATALNNLFDNVSSSEATAGSVDYRCFYVLNDNDTDTVNVMKIWMSAATPSTFTALSIGLDPAGVGADAQVIANEAAAPVGVTFSEPLDEAGAIAIGTLGPNTAVAVWVRRTVTAGATAQAGDGTTFELKGTPA